MKKKRKVFHQNQKKSSVHPKKKKKKFRLGPWAIQAQPRETKTNTPMI